MKVAQLSLQDKKLEPGLIPVYAVRSHVTQSYTQQWVASK